MNLQPHITRTLFQAALIVAGISLCNLANAQAYVAFEGRVILQDNDLHPVHMTLTDGTETMDVELGRTGNYKFFVPVDEKVTLNITSPGYMTKQVLLDTHNAPSTDGVFARTEKVGCDMELERQPEGQLLSYAGPVGAVAFVDCESRPTLVIMNMPQEKIALDTQASAMQ